MRNLVLAAALQPADGQEWVTLTLGTPGVLLLGALILLAASGWILVALSGRRAYPPTDVVPPGPAPHPDPAERSFLAASAGDSEMVFLVRHGRIERARLAPGILPEGKDQGLHGSRFLDLVEAGDLLPVAEMARALDRGDLESGSLTIALRVPAGAPPSYVRCRFSVPAGSPAQVWIASMVDVSGPARMARAAEEMESRLNLALEHLPDGVLLCSPSGSREEIVLANERLPALLGAAEDSGIFGPGLGLGEARRRLAEVHSPEAARVLLDDLDEPGSREVKLPTVPEKLLERTVRLLGDPPGSTGRLIAFRDITRERLIREELKRETMRARGARVEIERRQQEVVLANEGLERRMAEFAQVNRELKGLDEMKSNLLGNVSHELQTPLVSIKGYTEMMLKGRLGPLTEEQERGLKVSLRNADRLISMIDGLLAFVRSEKDASPLTLEVFPLRPLVEEVLALLEETAGEKSVRISVKLPPGDLHIKGDRARLLQVFINLVGNAIKYNRTRGTVTVSASRGPRGVARVEVQDSGIGIPREDLDRIFERFYRSGDEDRERGTGLGLAITKDILRLHGCKIRADSEPGKGSTFAFTLPMETRGKAERTTRAPAGEPGD